MSASIEDIGKAVEAMHECKASHEQSTPVIEKFGRLKVWEGVVESFTLFGHPKAERCYAWSYHEYRGEKRSHYVAILELPPVNSPLVAVRSYLASIVKHNRDVKIGERLRASREKCEKTVNEIAASIGIPINSYFDLEAGNDWFNAIALGEICLLTQLLDTTAAELLTGRTDHPIHFLTLEELKQKLIEWFKHSNIEPDAFEVLIGFKVAEFIKEPGAAKEWNIDNLRAVCDAIDVDWTEVSFC
jgi:hypothetical protein